MIDAEREFTVHDEVVGEQALASGSVALLIMSVNSLSLVRMPKLDLSLLAWKLMNAGNMPVWIVVNNRKMQDVKRHIDELALAPNLDGTIFDDSGDDQLTNIVSSHPQVDHVVIVKANNALATVHAASVGYHINNSLDLTLEKVRIDEHLGRDTGTMIFSRGYILDPYGANHNTTSIAVPGDARYLPVKSLSDLERAGETLASYRFK